MSIDPGLVPKRKLYSGALMPGRGLGTFGSDRVTADEVARAVSGALEVGYRHFDCAAVYENEDRIGQVFQGFPREQL
jgi:alcohol dehydrogenase (NADP+)